MTDQEQKEWDLKLRKMDAENARIYSNFKRHDAKIYSDIKQHDAKIVKMCSDINHQEAVIANLNAQTMKLATENRWYLLVVGAAFFAAATAFTKFFL